ncbi:phage tail-like protein [Bradyrhizobium japonicum]|uniref:phage tail protein n=1 Tax=Bradyrhizobium japonicum TaxID=375 RepID=UPI002169AE4E|nr:phage tail protein [Bradyrhizobium japonicum]MCS3499343.1 phage tail-like protein [Bradyrhizobium japonicum]MCS3958493.1 phage tail-like protein [Bradyrhizobium japonicum]MCS4000247.1 phage tail-like protein [Bradyrhizobium japonicum]
MSAPVLLNYRFANVAQWAAGMLVRGSVDYSGIVPLPRLSERAAVEYSKVLASCVAVSRRGELFWRDGDGRLHVGAADGASVWDAPAPSGISDKSRLIAWRSSLWALDMLNGVITRYFADTLQQADTIVAASFVDPDATSPRCELRDIASDGHDGVWVLAKTDKSRLFHVAVGSQHPRMLAWSGTATMLATIRRGELIALVGDDGSLEIIKAKSGVPSVKAVLPSQFKPAAIVGNGKDRIVLAGTAPLPAAAQAAAGRQLLVYDAEADLIDQVPLGPMQDANDRLSLAALRDLVWIADAEGVRRLQPGSGGRGRPVSAIFLTPTLTSPEGKERGWLRAELKADLPPGATLQVKYASSSDSSLISAVTRIASDRAVPPGQRQARINQLLTAWTAVEYRGEAARPCDGEQPAAPVTYSVPLHDATGTALWLAVELRAAEPGKIPKLLELDVRYPELSLMHRLPAIYRSKEGDRDGLLRSLVEVLEATTHGLQERIERLGTLIDPATAPEEWLDFLAAWTGMPWHETLSLQAKRKLLVAAGDLLAQRGTRAGLRLLLCCLLPDTPVHIVDSSVDLSPVILAGEGGAGGTLLPAVLLGRPHSYAVLGSPHAVLGRTHLRCENETACPRDLIEGRLSIRIAADAEDNAAVVEILGYLIRDYVPVGLRIDLRWRTAAEFGMGRRLDEDLVLETYRPAALDRRTVVGRSFLPRRGMGRLVSGGINSGFKLQ